MSNALGLQRQITQWLGTGPNATNVNFKDIGDEGRLKRDKNKLLGTGSGTRVFLGTFRQLVTNEEQLVAIKEILYNSDEHYIKTYSEVQNLLQLTHPNVVRYLFADKVDEFNIMLIALELCRGSLVDVFSHKHDVFKKPFILKNHMSCDNWLFKKHLLLGIADGLNYVHGQRFVHRDLKPQNILVRDDNNSSIYGYKAVICDFELTKKMKDGKTKLSVSQQAVGTHGWMAREVLNGSKKLTQAIDVFAYGCIVHYVLSEKRTEQLIHPFGSDLHRDTSILRGKRFSYISLSLKRSTKNENEEGDCSLLYNYLGDSILADMLVDVCISGSINIRPRASDILKHPLFWSYSEKMQCNEQMFNTFKDRFRTDSLIFEMETTWSNLGLANLQYLSYLPEVWHYQSLYREKMKMTQFSPEDASKLFNCLMWMIRNTQEHYQESVSLSPSLSEMLTPGDDETLGRYFFERVPMSFPVIYMYDRLYKDSNTGDYSDREKKVHDLLKGTLRNLHSDHPAL